MTSRRNIVIGLTAAVTAIVTAYGYQVWSAGRERSASSLLYVQPSSYIASSSYTYASQDDDNDTDDSVPERPQSPEVD